MPQWRSAFRGNLPGDQAALGAKNFDVLPMPTIPSPKGQVRATGGGSVAWGLSSGVKNTKQALDFLHWFFSPVGYAAAEATYGIVPAVTKIAADPNAIWAKLPNNPAEQRGVHDRCKQRSRDRAAGTGQRLLELADEHPERHPGGARREKPQGGDGRAAEADSCGLCRGVDSQAEAVVPLVAVRE